MTSVSFFLADAFTERLYSGNAAGVVANATDLSTGQMQQIAGELGQTETCFVRATSEPGADLELRWFTPTVEVDICGHATVAAFVCLDAEQRIDWTAERVQLVCATRANTGPIDVWLERRSSGSPKVTMSVGSPPIAPAADGVRAAACAIGLPETTIDPALPLAVEPAGARLIIPVLHLDDLLRFAPNGAGMIDYGLPRGYRRFTLVCRETTHPDHFAHLRHFAPANGIPEDPVTGTAHAVAAVYLDQNGLLPTGDHLVLTGEQGHAVGRRGVVTVELLRQSGHVREVRIGGGARIVARGAIETPDGTVDGAV